MTSTSFRNGIIARVELSHLQRTLSERRWWSRTGNWLLKGTFVFWAVFLVYAGMLAIGHPSGYQLPESAFLPLGVLAFWVTIIHFIVVYRAAVIASESVMRERRGKTWETLVITVIDARHLVLGKWWASMRTVWREFVFLSIMRAGAMVSIGIFVYLRLFLGLPVMTLAIPGLVKLILSVCLIVVFTLLNMAFTTAAGIVGGLITSRSEGVAVPMAQSVRLTTLLMPIIALMAVGVYLAFAPSGPHMNLENLEPGGRAIVALLDNGLFASAAVADSLAPELVSPLLVAFAAIIVYAGLTMTLLAIAQYIAQRQGILPPKTNAQR